MSSINGNSPKLCIDHLSPEVEREIEVYFSGGRKNTNPERVAAARDEIECAKKNLLTCVNKVFKDLLTKPSSTIQEEDSPGLDIEDFAEFVKDQLEASGKLEMRIKTNIRFQTVGVTDVPFRICRITFGN